ncbi:MDR family MFS transporter [Pradoshia sp.]
MNFFQFHRTIKIRIIESFLSTAVGSMVFPFMAIYLSFHFGVKTAGLLLLINVFVGIAINFFGGYFSDTFGRKKIIVVAESMRFLAFSTMMICNSPWLTAPLITFFMMTVNSICWGLAGPANQAMLIDVSKPEERKTMYTIMYWANNLSIAIGGIAGGFLFKEHLFELLLALSVATLITWFLITFVIHESYIPASTKEVKPTEHARKLISNYKEVFSDRVFVLFVLAGILVLSMEFQLTNYIGIRLANDLPVQNFFGLEFSGIEMTGFLRTENTILVVILALFATRMIAGLNDRLVLLTSCSVFVAGYVIISYTNNLWLLFGAMLFATFGEVLRVPVQQNYLANLPPEHARSSYLAVNGLTYNIGSLICSITITLSAYVPKLGTTIFMAIIGLLGILIFAKIIPALDERTKIDKNMRKEARLG